MQPAAVQAQWGTLNERLNLTRASRRDELAAHRLSRLP
jgi:hypothetical protein